MAYMSRDREFIKQAKNASRQSKDPTTKVGAVVVSSENNVLGTGWNGHPKLSPTDLRNNDDVFPWNKRGPDNKHLYVCHAELNAIAHSTGSLKGATIYVTLNPCNECAKLIVQVGIKRVVYAEEKDFKGTLRAAMKIFNECGVEIHQISA